MKIICIVLVVVVVVVGAVVLLFELLLLNEFNLFGMFFRSQFNLVSFCARKWQRQYKEKSLLVINFTQILFQKLFLCWPSLGGHLF